MKEGKCKSCGAKMLWVVMFGSGKKNPLNAEPDQEKGNVVIDMDGRGCALTGNALAEAKEKSKPLYLSHFATCPGAAGFRKTAS